MPHLQQYSAAHIQLGEKLLPEWTKRPFPSSWEAFEATVIEWVELVWPDWSCPHCDHKFWQVLEAVKLESASAWPIGEGSSFGSYPVVPISCVWCRQLTPILLYSIFEPPPAGAIGGIVPPSEGAA
jgi:hypothetical protein